MMRGGSRRLSRSLSASSATVVSKGEKAAKDLYGSMSLALGEMARAGDAVENKAAKPAGEAEARCCPSNADELEAGVATSSANLGDVIEAVLRVVFGARMSPEPVLAGRAPAGEKGESPEGMRCPKRSRGSDDVMKARSSLGPPGALSLVGAGSSSCLEWPRAGVSKKLKSSSVRPDSKKLESLSKKDDDGRASAPVDMFIEPLPWAKKSSVG